MGSVGAVSSIVGRRTIFIVGCHCEGEVGDVIVGGVRDVPGKTMHDKLVTFSSRHDSIRKLLLNEPRGRGSMNINLLLAPCDPRADAAFLTMGNEEYATMSGSNTICTATVLLETGVIPMQTPETRFRLDTAAGLISVTAQCEPSGRCTSVSFDNVPAFVAALDLEIDVPGIGIITVDVAFGGMWYALVDAASLGLRADNAHAKQLIEVGNLVLRCVQTQCRPIHPHNKALAGVSMISITEPVRRLGEGHLVGKHCVLVPPGRCDRSPCGTGTSARLAVLHKRGILHPNDTLTHESIIGSKFVATARPATPVGEFEAVVPTISGRAWITGHRQVFLDATDPYPEGFRVGDHWVMD